MNWRESSIKWKKTGNQDDFDIIFCLNKENEDNNVISELQKYKIELNSEIYRPILEKMYNQDGRGQPPIDPVLLFDIHILQAKYNLSDQQVINDIDDRESFQYFLGYPERLPKKSALNDFRNRIINSNIVHEIWTFHQDQLNSLIYSIPNEIAIDASFLDAGKGVHDKPRGEEAKTRRSRDGTFMTKNKETHFGYKMHMVMDLALQLIRAFNVTTVNVHDS